MLEKGAKLLIVHRRLFETDEPRIFIGTVEQFDGTLAKVTGFTWFRSPLDDLPIRKEGARTKLIAITSGALIVYILPAQINLETTRFEFSDDGRIWLRADPDFALDLSESHFRRIERMAG